VGLRRLGYARLVAQPNFIIHVSVGRIRVGATGVRYGNAGQVTIFLDRFAQILDQFSTHFR